MPGFLRRRSAANTPRFADADDDDEEELAEESEDELEERPADLWALRNVSFSIRHGESLGIIGGNGAGKTTLLKLLARVAPPSEGTAVVRGRVAPVMGLTTAFLVREQSVRENVRLVAQLFGIPREVADTHMDEVIAFADLEGHAESPVKSLSTGLARRLAFSTAMNLAPDVLLADGSLSVGDRDFRARCLDHVDQARREGLTVVLASHNMEMVRRFCTHGLWLESGEVRELGECGAVVAAYERWKAGSPGDLPRGRERASAEEAVLLTAGIFSGAGELIHSLSSMDDALIELDLETRQAHLDVQCATTLFGQDGGRKRLLQPGTFHVAEPGRWVVSVYIPAGLLGDGVYTAGASAYVGPRGNRARLHIPAAFTFDVQDPRDGPPESEDELEETGEGPPAVALRWAINRSAPVGDR